MIEVAMIISAWLSGFLIGWAYEIHKNRIYKVCPHCRRYTTDSRAKSIDRDDKPGRLQ